MNKKVIVIGYGSIGKVHVKNLVSLGITPCVVTSYPETGDDINFVSTLDACGDYDYAIICTETANHLKDFTTIASKTKCKSVLIEKPLASTLEEAVKIKDIASKNNIKVNVAYDMRFLKVFNLVKEAIKKYSEEFRIVKIEVGQFLPEWRPYKSYKESYSSHRNRGGGVDLDLSHEIDYMLWLFGFPKEVIFTFRDNVSKLTIDSPDYFKGIYRYPGFIADVEMDYIRKLSRRLTILGENNNILEVDFIQKTAKLKGKDLTDTDLFNYNDGFLVEVREFLNLNDQKRICSIAEGMEVLKLLKLEKDNV